MCNGPTSDLCAIVNEHLQRYGKIIADPLEKEQLQRIEQCVADSTCVCPLLIMKGIWVVELLSQL